MTKRGSSIMVIARRVLYWASFWILGAATWLLLVDTVYWPELAAGAIAAALCTALVELVREQHVVRLAPHQAFLLGFFKQLAQVPFDLWLLARELARALAGRHPAGRFHTIPYARGGDSPRNNSRSAAIEGWGSLAPNTLVLGVDEQEIVVHQLAARASARRRLQELA